MAAKGILHQQKQYLLIYKLCTRDLNHMSAGIVQVKVRLIYIVAQLQP